MPPLPRLRIAAIDELDRQLRFSSPETARKQLERVESMCREIEPDRTYPEEWVIFRITGYRIDKPSHAKAAPALLIGSALIGDLVSFVERLSVTARITEQELLGSPSAWVSAADVCDRWNISRKTLDRYRKDGIPGRRAATATARSKLYFHVDVVARFEQLHQNKLIAASTFTRIDAAMEEKLVRLARRYHERLGWSLNQTAKRLAERYGRGHETVRSLLARHDADSTRTSQRTRQSQPGKHRPVFDNPGPLNPRQQRVIQRAFDRGIDAQRLADHFGKSKPSIYRVLAMTRSSRLRALALHDQTTQEHSNRSTSGAALRQSSCLTEPAATTGLGAPSPRTLGDLSMYAAHHTTPDQSAERVRASAYDMLVARAAMLVSSLSPHHPTPGKLDEIETMLRWAARLKAELVRSQLSLLLKTISSQLGKDLVSLPRGLSVGLLDECLASLFDAVDRFDPLKGGRLAAPCGLALSRVVSLWQRRTSLPAASVLRTMAYTNPDLVELRDWTRCVSPWQAWLEPHPAVRERLHRAPPLAQELLNRRYGWLGSPPTTLAAVGITLGMTTQHSTALERATCLSLRWLKESA